MITEPYPEHDKLGPLGAPVARAFGEGADLRAPILAAFRGALDEAEGAALDPSVDAAVHRVRKALRRARAILRIVAAELRKDDRRDLARAIVDARRTLSAARDLAVAPEALDEVGLDDEARAAAFALLAGVTRAALPADEVRRLLVDVVARVRPLADALAAALPATLAWADVEDGVVDTYRVVRRALRRRSRRAFHVFRKRAKELTYQLELLADGARGRTDALRRGVATLGDSLGLAVDLIMLRDVLAASGADADLLDEVDDELARRIKAARRAGREVFDRRPRAFARKLRRAVRRDHAERPATVARA